MINLSDCSLTCLGRKLVLTDLRPPAPEDLPEEALAEPIFDKNQWFTPIGDYICHKEMLEGFTPYALNFNLDASDNNLYYNSFILDEKGRMRNADVLKTKDDQYCYMHTLIHKWFKRFRSSLRTFSGEHYSHIGPFAVFFEMTQRGIIHGHGLMYINNSYHESVSQLMSMAWVKVANVKFCAQQKYSACGKLDRTFSKCNNVDSWVKYITKEQRHKVYLAYLEFCRNHYTCLYKYNLRRELIEMNF